MNTFPTIAGWLLAQASQPVVVHKAEPDAIKTWGELAFSLASSLVVVVITAGIPFAVAFLRKKAKEMDAGIGAKDAERDKHASEGGKADEQRRTLLSERVKRIAVGTAAAIADKRFPALAQDIVSGKVRTKADVKDELYRWGDYLYDEILKQMSDQGVDVKEILGTSYVKNIVERAADQVSPFPGKDTAAALVAGGAKLILKFGVDYVRTVNKIQPEDAPALDPVVAAAVVTADRVTVNPMQPLVPSGDDVVPPADPL